MTEQPKAKLLSLDSCMDTGKIDPNDAKVLLSGKTGQGLVSVTKDQLIEVARGAAAKFDELTVRYSEMTVERVAEVRRLRVVERYSWRAVAREMALLFPALDIDPGNQIDGMALCQAAAERRREDFRAGEWN